MWKSKDHNDTEGKKVLSWRDFPAERQSREESMTPQIAAYLRRTLEKYEESEFIKYLVVPSPIALSGFFHCSEEEIHHALVELQAQGYEFETAGSTGPITLWDPLIRRKPVTREQPGLWQLLYENLTQPVGRAVAG